MLGRAAHSKLGSGSALRKVQRYHHIQSRNSVIRTAASGGSVKTGTEVGVLRISMKFFQLLREMMRSWEKRTLCGVGEHAWGIALVTQSRTGPR